MNGAKAFFDTNVLLYMYGGATLGKQAQATELFRRYAQSGRMLLSTQVVQNSTQPVPAGHAAELQRPLGSICRWSPLWAHILAAIRIEERYIISFWDALILAQQRELGRKFCTPKT